MASHSNSIFGKYLTNLGRLQCYCMIGPTGVGLGLGLTVGLGLTLLLVLFVHIGITQHGGNAT